MAQTYSLNWLKSDLRKSIVNLDVDLNLLDSVLGLAYRYHDGQFREHKEGVAKRVPYITHPVGVAKICAELWPEVELSDRLEDILAVALTHDLLEDTAISIQELEQATSRRASELVQVLTKPVSTGFVDRSARNRAFLDTISKAGASAKFIKICDALHNLSRPESVPGSLLKKTIRKAKRDYLPLTIDPHFTAAIRQRLEATVAESEQKLTLIDERGPAFDTLEEFLRYCVERASGKVLETHDIIDALLELPGFSMLHEGTVLDFEKFILVDWLEPVSQKHAERYTERLLDKGELVLSGKGFERKVVRNMNFQKVFLLPLEGSVRDLRHRHFFVLGCDTSRCPSWATNPILRAAIAILSERQRERDARELADYAEWVTKAGLDIDPRSAAELRLTPEQIEHLARLIDAAAIEIGAILAGVDLIARSLSLRGRILLLEHRIKAANSAAVKLVRRGGGDWGALDDLIGVRVVLLNDKAVNDFVAAFQAQCADSGSVWNADMGLVQGSSEIAKIKSSGGYCATHLRFRVTNALEGVGEVNCEIQVRTVFQDAWARIAHETRYKLPGRGSKRLQRNLKDLSRMCNEADQLTNRLIE